MSIVAKNLAAAAPQVWNSLPDSVRDFTLCKASEVTLRPRYLGRGAFHF